MFGLDLEWAMIGVLVIEQAKDPFMPLDAYESPFEINFREQTTQLYLSLIPCSDKLDESCSQKVLKKVY